MIQGIGTDLVEIARLKEACLKHADFPEKVLTESELKLLKKRKTKKGQLEFLAGRWAAKEAFTKATGTGIGLKVGFHDIEILADEKDRPYICTDLWEGAAFVSITHTAAYAAAFVILEDQENP